MFGVAYYPTPRSLAVRMCSLIDWKNVFSVIDPSCGKGSLLDVAREKYGRHGCLETLAIELDPVLQMVAKAAGHRLIDTDWLQYDGKDRFDALLINPPFHEGAAHLLKAINDGEPLRAIDTRHFIVNVYKKGTIHLQFKDKDTLRRLNIWIGKRRQWLFREHGDVRYSDMTAEQRREVSEFAGGEQGYKINHGPLCAALESAVALPALHVA